MKRMLFVLAVVSSILALSCDMPAQVVAPTAPTNVRIESGALLWSAVSGADSYKVFISSDASSWLTAASLSGTSFSPLAAGSYYAVTAVNTGGESARSSPLVLNGAPPAPKNLSIVGDVLSWEAVPCATSYSVYYSSDNTAYGSAQWTGVTATQQTVSDGGYYKVSALNGSSEGVSSDPVHK